MSWSDEQLAEFQASVAWRTAQRLPDGRVLGVSKNGDPIPHHDPRVEAARALLRPDTRMLELGACEGQHTVALAPWCAEVVAVEARPANAARARVRQLVHQVENVRNRVADVDTLDWSELGRFGVCLHAGLLYHLLDPVRHLIGLAPWVDALVLDTHVARAGSGRPEVVLEVDGASYRGQRFVEAGGWADPFGGVRPEAVWLFPEDLRALLGRCGFDQLEVFREDDEPNGPRVGWVARRSLPESPERVEGRLEAAADELERLRRVEARLRAQIEAAREATRAREAELRQALASWAGLERLGERDALDVIRGLQQRLKRASGRVRWWRRR